MAPLPAADQRYPWLKYQVEEYTEGIIHIYEQRLETIWSSPVNRVHVLDFEGLTPGIRHDLAVRLRMVYTREGQQVFVSHAWRRSFGFRAPLVREFILEFLSMSDTEMGLDVADKLCFQLGGVRRRMTWRQFILALGLHTEQEMAEAGDFLGPTPSYVLIRDPVRRLCHKMIAYSISGRGQTPEKYLFRHAERRKSGARLSGGHFIRCLAMHFGLVSNEGLRGLQIVTRELLLIDLHELGKLNICSRFGDTWAWVAQGPERQQAAAAGAHEADEAGPAADEDAQEIPTPSHAPPPAPQPRTMSRMIERIEEEMRDL
ncbi:hypothetical protein Tco_0787815 [Tanacetum coccineum]